MMLFILVIFSTVIFPIILGIISVRHPTWWWLLIGTIPYGLLAMLCVGDEWLDVLVVPLLGFALMNGMIVSICTLIGNGIAQTPGRSKSRKDITRSET